MMTSGEATGLVAVIGSFLTFLGVTGVDAGTISGAVNGIIGIVTFVAAVWTWWKHRQAAKDPAPAVSL